MNKATEIFVAMLDLIEFELVNYEDGYGLVDLQGANLADIESDRFQTVEQIIDRLDAYINDYYLDDLEDEAETYGLLDSIEALGYQHGEVKPWLDFAEKFKGDPDVDKFVTDHKHEFEALDMMYNHADEVKLDVITARNGG